jgi:PAS domain S-box-containing protein
MTMSDNNMNGPVAPALQPLTAALLESVTPAEVARVIVDRGMTVLGADAGLVALVTGDGADLELVESRGYEPAVMAAWRRFPIDADLPLSNAVRARRSIFVGTRGEWESLYPHMAPKSSRQTQATVDLPLVESERVFGGLHFSFPDEREFGEDDRAFLLELARQCSMALSRAAAFVDNQRLYAEAQREIAERIATEEALRDSEARHAAIVNAAFDCIITIDERERIVEWNPAAERTFGYARQEAVGRILADLIVPERFRAAHRRGVARFLTTGDGPVLNKRLELSAIRASGEEFPMEVTVAPIEIGDAFIFTAYLRDISERVRIAEQRRVLLRDMLLSVTDAKLHLCNSRDEIPPLLEPLSDPVPLSMAVGIAALRHETTSAADLFHFSQDRCSDFVTAASEAAMNAVIHGGGGEARVFGDRDTGALQVLVEDQGTGIAMDTLPHAALSRGYSTAATLGHGLKMIIEMVDRVSLVTGPDGTVVLLEKSREQRLPAWLDR